MEIKFRGLSIHGGFVYGYYAYTSKFSNRNDYFKNVIITKDGDIKEIEEGTQALFTGLFDKNGKEIYVGDIIKIHNIYNEERYCIVGFYRGQFCLQTFTKLGIIENEYYHFFPPFGNTNLISKKGDTSDYEIIGNIYKNKDLLNNN